VEAGSVRKLDRPLVGALVKALGTDPIRERALLVTVLARRAIAADQTGPDRAMCDGQAREMLARVLPFPAR
jgi:hypothetical protein